MASCAAFGRPLVMNVHRGLLAEAIVSAALGPSWTWCSEDYAPYDFRHANGCGLEVKQSAARQSWSGEHAKASRPTFDIRQRRTQLDGSERAAVLSPRRHAQIYVFAHHAVLDATADHRDPDQWTFYVVPTALLPVQKTIGIGGVRQLAPGCTFQELNDVVEAVISIAEHVRSTVNSEF